MSDDKNINFVLGEIVGTQKQILDQIQENRRTHDVRYKETQEQLKVTQDHVWSHHRELQARLEDHREELAERFQINTKRIDKIEKDIHAARWVSRALLWLGGAIGSMIAWIAHKLEWV